MEKYIKDVCEKFNLTFVEKKDKKFSWPEVTFKGEYDDLVKYLKYYNGGHCTQDDIDLYIKDNSITVDVAI